MQIDSNCILKISLIVKSNKKQSRSKFYTLLNDSVAKVIKSAMSVTQDNATTMLSTPAFSTTSIQALASLPLYSDRKIQTDFIPVFFKLCEASFRSQ